MTRRLTYWHASYLPEADRHGAYDFRFKTRRSVVAAIARHAFPEEYGPPHKVTVEYDDVLDLLKEGISSCSTPHWEIA